MGIVLPKVDARTKSGVHHAHSIARTVWLLLLHRSIGF
jgi:hypothetical protein